MNIIFISPSLKVNKGGVERHTLEIAKRLARNNKVTVITEAASGEVKKANKYYHSILMSDNEANVKESGVESSFFIRKKIENVNILCFDFGNKGFKKKFVIWRRMLQLAPLIKDADVIHSHDVFVWILPLRILFPFKKMYVTFHGYEGYPIAFRAKLIRRVSKALSNGSINVGKFIEKWYGTKSDRITYGAVDNKEFGQPLSIHPVKSKAVVKIAFIGRLEKINCLPQLFDFIKLFRNKRINFILEWYGDGSLRGKCIIMGKIFTQRSDLRNRIASVDLILSSSYLSILEGLINKKRVFSLYNDPVKKDYLFMTPFSRYISISNSSKELTRQIEAFINNKTGYTSDIEEGYNWAKKQTWEALTKEYLKLWKI